MQEKRLLLALVLSFVILFVFNVYFRPPQQPQRPPSDKSLQYNKLSKETSPLKQKHTFADKEFIEWDTGKAIFKISKKYGYIREVFLKEYNTYLPYKNIFFLPALGEVEKIDKKGKNLILKFNDNTLVYNISTPYVLEVNLEKPLKSGEIHLFSKIPEKEKIERRFQEFFYEVPKKIRRVSPLSLKGVFLDKNQIFGMRNRYFCIVYRISLPVKIQGLRQDSRVEFLGVFSSLDKIECKVYIGPQVTEFLSKESMQEVISYGFFGGISKFILKILKGLNKIFHNWGWSIIFLSIVIYFILFPFTIISSRSMLKLQKLQPHIEELRQKYKDNPQKLNKEIMELYKIHRVNPLGGCLPLIFQIPVFIGLYQGLLRSLELRGASFLWIKDLSLPDHTFKLPVNLPFLGEYLNLFPIIMALLMFFQQKFTQPQTSGGEHQKILMLFFPLFLGVIFYNFPSGLVLYWLINSLLTFIYQYRLKKISLHS